MMKIIYDHQLDSMAIMPLAIKAVEQFLVAANHGNTLSPPRYEVNLNNGGLTFTIGAETEFSQAIGFRVYDTFPHDTLSHNSLLHKKGTDSDQIVAIYSTQKSQLKGLFLGSKLGSIRTAAINGVALKYMSNPKAQIATIIGAGHQAKYQIMVLLAVRPLKTIYIHNRSAENAQNLIEHLQPRYQVEFKLSHNLAHSLGLSDIVICATSSPQPILKTQWLKPDCYIGSIGAKYGDQHELPLDITDKSSSLITDSLVQLNQYKPPYQLDNLQSLADIMSHRPHFKTGLKIFLSTGLSGTEVAVGDAILKKFI